MRTFAGTFPKSANVFIFPQTFPLNLTLTSKSDPTQ